MTVSPVGALVAIVAVAAAVSAAAPMPVALLSVFAFAGPHNWFELRYLLGRLPARLSPFRAYFLTAAAGVVLLSVGSMLLVWRGRAASAGVPWASIWISGVAAWVWVLLVVRAREIHRRAPGWVAPVLMMVAAVGWWAPAGVGVALVYIHPAVALWFLDRELRGRHRADRSAYRRSLWLIPAAVVAIWIAGPPAVAYAAGGAGVVAAVGRQTGADVFGTAFGGRLIATHVFLELVHYGVWIAIMPMVAIRGPVFGRAGIALWRRAGRSARLVAAALLGAGFVVAALWIGFTVDYRATRDLYFTLAIVHVLVEVPALIRLP